MKKTIAAVASVTAIAALAVPALASASVDRYQMQTGTLNVSVGYQTVPDLASVHTYTGVIVNPCDGTFTSDNGSGIWTNGGETISGKISNGVITSFTATYPGSYRWYFDSAKPTNVAGYDNEGRTFDVTNALPLTNLTNVKNHGEYVSSQGGGDDAAHSCIGMPINSSK